MWTVSEQEQAINAFCVFLDMVLLLQLIKQDTASRIRLPYVNQLVKAKLMDNYLKYGPDCQ